MRKIILIVGSLLCCLFSNGQEAGNGSKKGIKVGLVLSGGGAKGMAHIGALKIIEKAGVKIDYIGGTSMGAIVGALYAAGYSAAELDSIFRATDFSNLIKDNLPRGAKTFYEKENSERYAISLPFNKFKLSLPPAYSGGQNVYNELVRLLYPVKDVKDFNKLPIPFLCIATDVETGKEILLNKGYLPEAVMASGALPSLFQPAEINGQLLIDGGVVNNYPIDEVKKLGADVIIGVDVQHGLRDRDALLSATEILLQISNYRTALDMEKKTKETDIYIKPDMLDYSVIDFNLKNKIIKSGEVAAEKQYAALEKLAIAQNRKEAKPKPPKLQDTIKIDQLILKGNNHYTRGYIKGKLRFDLAKKITFETLQQGINNLSATGNFQTVRYDLLSDGNDVDLLLKLKENPNKTYLRMGAHYDDLYKSAAILNLTRKNLLMKDDVASFDFILGDNVRYNMQYYVDKGSYWSFGINSEFTNFDKQVDFNLIRSNYGYTGNTNLNNINMEVTDLTNQLYVQTVLREEFSVSLGLEHKFLKYGTRTLSALDSTVVGSTTSASDRTFFEKSHYFSAFGKLKLDTYDDKYFPTRGLFFDGDFYLYLFSSDYNNNFKEYSIAKARMGVAFPLCKGLSLNLETSGGFKLGTSGVTSLDFVLGGYGNNPVNNFTPFLGYDFLSLPGNSYVKAYGRLDYEFAAKNHLLFAVNYANVEDDIFRTGEWFTAPNFSGYALGYGWQSFIGPVQVLYSWSPETKAGDFFFSIGYWF